MEPETEVFNLMGIEHECHYQKGTGCLIVNAQICNELRDNKKGFNLIVGGFSFLGEGSGPYEQGDDKDPERRAEVTGELILAGWFEYLEDAEKAGEMAISTKGYYGVYGDNYVIPEVAKMRIIGE